MKTHPKYQGWILYGFIYMGFLLVHGILLTGAEGVYVYYDSFFYYQLSHLSLTDSGFWGSLKTPVSLIFYKLFGDYEFESHVSYFVNDDVFLLYGQTVTYLAAFSLLAFACAKSGQNGKGCFLLFIFPLLFSVVPSILRWNFIALSESFSISLFVSFIAVWIMFLQTKHLSWLVGVAIVALLWGGVRDTNAYVLVMIAFVIMATLIRSYSLKRASMMALCVWFVCIFMLSDFSANTGSRWLNPYYNNIGLRILPVPEFTSWFSVHGMPVNPDLMMRSGKDGASDDGAIYNDPNLEEFRAWSIEHGKMTYAKFLLTNFVYTITAPIHHVASDFSSFAFDVRIGASTYLSVHPRASSYSTIVLIYFLIVYGLTIYYAFVWWRCKQLHHDPYLAVPLVMVLLSAPHAWISWHGDAQGDREAFLARICSISIGVYTIIVIRMESFEKIAFAQSVRQSTGRITGTDNPPKCSTIAQGIARAIPVMLIPPSRPARP